MLNAPSLIWGRITQAVKVAQHTSFPHASASQASTLSNYVGLKQYPEWQTKQAELPVLEGDFTFFSSSSSQVLGLSRVP